MLAHYAERSPRRALTLDALIPVPPRAKHMSRVAFACVAGRRGGFVVDIGKRREGYPRGT